MSDGLSDYWAALLERRRVGADAWREYSAPIVPRHEPAADTVKELYWKMRAERLQRELDALKHPYFWLGREAD